MNLVKWCKDHGLELHEYPVPAPERRQAWACDIKKILVHDNGCTFSPIGIGKTRKTARKRLAEQLKGKTISIHVTVPADLKA